MTYTLSRSYHRMWTCRENCARLSTTCARIGHVGCLQAMNITITTTTTLFIRPFAQSMTFYIAGHHRKYISPVHHPSHLDIYSNSSASRYELRSDHKKHLNKKVWIYIMNMHHYKFCALVARKRYVARILISRIDSQLYWWTLDASVMKWCASLISPHYFI